MSETREKPEKKRVRRKKRMRIICDVIVVN